MSGEAGDRAGASTVRTERREGGYAVVTLDRPDRFGALPAAGGPQRLARVIGPGRTKLLVAADAGLAEALRLGYRIIDTMASPEERVAEVRRAMERSSTYGRIFGSEKEQ